MNGVDYMEQLASVVRVHLMALDETSPRRLAPFLGLSVEDTRYRFDGVEPWTVVDLVHLADLFGMRVSDLLREAESRPVESGAGS